MKHPVWFVILLEVTAVPCAASAAPRARNPERRVTTLADNHDAGGGSKRNDAENEFLAEVSVLHATNSKKGIDERIGKMPELKKPPFSSYDSYELLTKQRVSLKKDDPKSIKLPNGRVLQAKLLDILPKDVLRISASFNQPGGKDFLPLLEVKAKRGQAFIVAGQNYKNGILVLVIRVVK